MAELTFVSDPLDEAGDAAVLDAYSRAVIAVAERLAPSVAAVKVLRRGRERGSGSGVVITSNGFALTSAHVVAGGDRVRATFTDGREFEAEIVGTDALSDLAVLRGSGAGPSRSPPRTASAAP